MKKAAFILTLAVSVFAFASSAEHGAAAHGEDHIPFSEIGWQALNLGILLFAIIYFLRKSMIEAFAKRQQDYLNQAEKTKASLKEAEAALADIKNKLSTLESGELKSIENAKAEAIKVREGIVREAELASAKMKKDAELVIGNELLKAKSEINAAIFEQAVAASKLKIESSAKAVSQNLEAGFIKQLEQVK